MMWLRQGLKPVARKAGNTGPACCGGDLGSPRKAAGPGVSGRGLPLKARSRPNHKPLHFLTPNIGGEAQQFSTFKP
jgi:hypothetical protein